MIIPTSISATLSYKAGDMIVRSAIPICCGSVVGGYAGSKISGKMYPDKIQCVLVGLLNISCQKNVL